MLARSLIRTSCCTSGRGVVYEVSVRFTDPSISEQYSKWLSDHHVEEVLQFPGFESAEILSQVDQPGVVVRYNLASEDVFTKYNGSEIAKKLRADAIGLFGDKFQASRRVLISQSMHFR
jgi:hypothetical protein